MDSITGYMFGIAALALIGAVAYVVFGGSIAEAIANLQQSMDLTQLVMGS